MVGNDLNILPRERRPFITMKAVLLLLVCLLLAAGDKRGIYAQNLINSGQINNTGTLRVKNQAVGLPPVMNGTVEYFGANQTVSPVQYKILVLSGSGTKASSAGNFTVTDSVRIGLGDVLQIDSSSVLNLGGDLEEDGYLLGKIRKTVDLSGATTASQFGNIGAGLTWSGTAPGVTTITRSSGVALSGAGHQSIKRYYDINPATNSGLNAGFVFKYSNNELNGEDSTKLQLWRSTDNGATWQYVDAVVDPVARTITRAGIDSFARWTASDTANFPIGVVQTYARIIVRHYIDLDGNLATITDRPGQRWGITIHQDSINGLVIGSVASDTVLDVRSNTGGNFYIVENDSTGWTRLGYQRDISPAVSSATNTVNFSAFPPQTTTFRFFTFKNGSIAGNTFNDANADSVKEQDENGLSGWKIRLYRNGVSYDSVLTGSDGNYLFSNLTYGSYTVNESLQTGGGQSGWLETSPAPLNGYVINLQSGQNVSGKNFGNYKYSSITGKLFEDVNANGTFETGEPSLANWKLRLLKSGVQVDSTLTQSDGTYQFNALLPGTYIVQESLQTGWLQTLPGAGQYAGMSIASDTHLTGKDFGNYRAGVIAGMVFYDRNANGIKDADESGLTGWTITATAGNSSNNKTTTSQPGGLYSLTPLKPDNYTVSLSLKSNWVQSFPNPATYSDSVVSGSNFSGQDFGATAPSDTFKFRTFTMDSLTTPKGIVKTKCSGFKFAFDFTNKTGRTANGMYVAFNNVVTNFTSETPFTDAADLGINAQAYKLTGASVAPGQTIRIEGFSIVTPCRIRISKWWWLSGDSDISKRKSEGPMNASSITNFLPMPNVANARDEVFLRGFNFINGLRVGIIRNDSNRVYGWVRILKSADLLKSLTDRYGMHIGTPRGFNQFSNKGRFVGELKSLPPTKQNNRLFADLAALKFNLEASTIGVTPAGLGELVYDESNNPLSGMLIKDIATRADTLMTFWMNKQAGLYINMDTTVQKLNSAFTGPMDTISFASRLVLKGVKSVNEVPYLRLPEDITPIIRQEKEIFAAENDQPEAYMLYQNYPNPFNPVTTIELTLPYSSEVTLKVYNVLGQEVATLIDRQVLDRGMQTVEFYADGLATGVYFYKVIANQITADGTNGKTFVDTKKMMYVK